MALADWLRPSGSGAQRDGRGDGILGFHTSPRLLGRPGLAPNAWSQGPRSRGPGPPRQWGTLAQLCCCRSPWSRPEHGPQPGPHPTPSPALTLAWPGPQPQGLHRSGAFCPAQVLARRPPATHPSFRPEGTGGDGVQPSPYCVAWWPPPRVL